MTSAAVNQWRRVLGVTIEAEQATVVGVAGETVALATRSGVVIVRPPDPSVYTRGDRVTIRSGQIVGRARREPAVYVV
jgi:hypothetical protein